MLLGAALPLEVDRHQVRPGRDEEPDDLATEARVGHRLRDLPEDAARHARVALRGAVAERGVGLVDHHGDGVHRPQDRQDLLEVALGDALPLAAEVLQHHHRDADLAREGRDEERLARADGPRDEVAHRHHVRPAGLDGLGRGAQVRLGLGVPGDDVEREAGLDELEQPIRLGFDEFFLFGRERLEGQPAAVLEHVGEDGAELHVAQPGGVLHEREVGDVGERVEARPRARAAGAVRAQEPVREGPALLEVGQLDVELGVVGALDERPREVVEVLGDEDEREVGLEQERVVRPLLERDEGRAVLGGVARRLGHRDDGLGVVDDARDALALAEAQPEVVVQQGEDAGRVLRHPLGVVGGEEGVVARDGPGEVPPRLGVEKVDAVRAVVEHDQVAPGEEVVGEELPQRDVLPHRPSVGARGAVRRHEVADVAVQDELVERLREVLPGELAGPLGVVRERVGGGGLGHRERAG